MVFAFANCERHNWQGETSELFEPHHGEHGDGGKHGDGHAKEAHAKKGEETGGEKPADHQAETGDGSGESATAQEGAARKVFPR